MKNRFKSKLLLSIFVDFVILVFLFSVICGSIFIAKLILYPEQKAGGEMNIMTERMPSGFLNSISVGDAVFDTLTKRRVGEVTAIEAVESENEVYFLITLNAAFRPRSKALRTNKLWFYFKEVDV